MAALPRRTRLVVLLLTAGLGALLFLWRLGSTGLVDETPPLFAASARAMVERGDWLIPHVNGLPRYDKPPLVYWLMGLLFALPAHERWDPLGTWASSLPSALATISVMLALADTLLRWPQPAPLRSNAAGEAGPLPPPSGGATAALGAAAATGATAATTAATAWSSAEPGGAGVVTASLGLPPRATEVPAASPAASADGALQPALAALGAALAYGLSPLVLLWGRIPVSDGLFTALVALTCLAVWRRLADPAQPWPLPWLLLGLAVLTKGPVAVVLLGLTLTLFLLLQGNAAALLRRLRLLRGLALTALVALPWYLLALWRDGRAFWDSFIGYHNLQRFTAVVNEHLEPWWYFAPVLLVAALPVTPLLLLALVRAVGPLRLRRWRGLPLPAAAGALPLPDSLARFAACWLLAILLFFTIAATKLPSYWLPATPAAALLVAWVAQLPTGAATASGPRGGAAHRLPAPVAGTSPLAAIGPDRPAAPAGPPDEARRDPSTPVPPSLPERRSASPDNLRPAGSAAAQPPPWPGAPQDGAFLFAWRLSLALAALLALVFALAGLWVPQIFDPEMPSLPSELLASGYLIRSAWLWGLAALLGWGLRARPSLRLLALQLPLVLWVPLALLPSWALGDRLRGLPVRQIAAAASRQAAAGEPLAMVGILKPSLHFYSRRVVIYEGIEPEGLVNLADRLRHEQRPGQNPAPPERQPSVLVVIDGRTAAEPFWRGLAPQELSRAGLYKLWRLDRGRLEQRAAALRAAGHPITWSRPRPERY